MSLRDRFELVIFDWAGTMVDFGCQAPVMALLDVFARRGVTIGAEQARRDMGKAKIEHVRALLNEPQVSRAWREIRGADPVDRDALDIMVDLEPVMREQAGRAALLIDGALTTYQTLRADGLKIGSSTGYTREMMELVLSKAKEQGYVPDHVVCAGETLVGRPSPLMVYKACLDLGVWPMSRVVKVDDTEAGVAEGRAAGCFTVGVAASGNGMGLDRQAFDAMPVAERAIGIQRVSQSLRQAGADVIVDSVAALLPALRSHG